MPGSDLSIRMPDGLLNVRVGAIITDAGRILAVRNSGETSYYTVGGRVHFGESIQEAATREAYEETGLRMDAERLLYIHENFFPWGDTQALCHELAFYFLMKPHDGLRSMKRTDFDEPYGRVSLHWLPLDGLGDIVIYPPFLGEALRDITSVISHYTTRGGITERV